VSKLVTGKGIRLCWEMFSNFRLLGMSSVVQFSLPDTGNDTVHCHRLSCIRMECVKYIRVYIFLLSQWTVKTCELYNEKYYWMQSFTRDLTAENFLFKVFAHIKVTTTTDFTKMQGSSRSIFWNCLFRKSPTRYFPYSSTYKQLPSVVLWLACLPQDTRLRVPARPRTVDFYGR
jgi:hypothetical protein